jgi:hypothetical protein
MSRSPVRASSRGTGAVEGQSNGNAFVRLPPLRTTWAKRGGEFRRPIVGYGAFDANSTTRYEAVPKLSSRTSYCVSVAGTSRGQRADTMLIRTHLSRSPRGSGASFTDAVVCVTSVGPVVPHEAARASAMPIVAIRRRPPSNHVIRHLTGARRAEFQASELFQPFVPTLLDVSRFSRVPAWSRVHYTPCFLDLGRGRPPDRRTIFVSARDPDASALPIPDPRDWLLQCLGSRAYEPSRHYLPSPSPTFHRPPGHSTSKT